MRTPPPVLPPDYPSEESSGGFRRSMFDRRGPEAVLRVKAAGYSLVVFALTGVLWYVLASRRLDLRGATAALFTLVASTLSALFAYRGSLVVADAAGGVARAATMPSGNSTPYEEQFSYQDAMAARGDVAGALESFEAVIAERPGVVAPRLRAAELYAMRGNDPRRAAALFREVRDTPGVEARLALYASSRLVDLYDGPLQDTGRAIVELRRIVERHPGTPNAAHARAAIPAIKARLARLSGGEDSD